MKYVLIIALILLVLFGWGAAVGFVKLAAVGAVILLGVVSAYLVIEGIMKKEWGSALCWGIVLLIWLKIFL